MVFFIAKMLQVHTRIKARKKTLENVATKMHSNLKAATVVLGCFAHKVLILSWSLHIRISVNSMAAKTTFGVKFDLRFEI